MQIDATLPRSRAPIGPSDSRHDERIAGGLVALQRELHAHAMRLTRNPTLAEDLVQDSIERALRFEDRFERGTNLRAWAHHILANVFISRCRSRRREGRALDLLSTDPCAWTARCAPPHHQGGLSRATRRALESLPAAFRMTVTLIDVQDCSYKAAADRLGVPIGTVMSRLHRGRRLLADALRDSETQPRAA
jgi:RNA polymerase sigma-70 factor (ECF subfamily)